MALKDKYPYITGMNEKEILGDLLDDNDSLDERVTALENGGGGSSVELYEHNITLKLGTSSTTYGYLTTKIISSKNMLISNDIITYISNIPGTGSGNVSRGLLVNGSYNYNSSILIVFGIANYNDNSFILRGVNSGFTMDYTTINKDNVILYTDNVNTILGD